MEYLIPPRWFDPLPVWLLLAVAVAGLSALIRGADWLVDAAARGAYRMGISKVVVGATVISLGTTSPEAAVSVLAAWSGHPGLALGNAVGSICADTGLIFGLGCLLAVLPAQRYILNRQGWVQFGAALLLAGICYGAFALHGGQASIGRWVGALLLGLLVLYLIVSVHWSRQGSRREAREAATAGPLTRREGPAEATAVPEEVGPGALVLVGRGLMGLLLVIIGSEVLIRSITVVAERWHVPQVVIAATLVALGTSLPEMAVGLTSLAKGHAEILVGNIIGADVLNVLFVIGASAAASNLPIIEEGARVPQIFLYLHLPAMLLILLLFRIFIFSAVRRGRFRRWYGVPLLAVYAGYVITQYLVSL